MFDAGLVQPRTTISYRQVPVGIHVLWSSRTLAIVRIEDKDYKIRLKWVIENPDFDIRIDAITNFGDNTGKVRDSETVVEINYHSWLEILQRLRKRYPKAGR